MILLMIHSIYQRIDNQLPFLFLSLFFVCGKLARNINLYSIIYGCMQPLHASINQLALYMCCKVQNK